METYPVCRIIVGVKYCFRYNQRNRRAQNDESGEPIDMTAMPRTHRRRREKKLMTMDEVNERFPLLKYKAWMTSRAEEGLPTAGGVAAPSSSRAASLRNAEGVLPNARKSHDVARSPTPEPKQSSEENNDSPEVAKTSPEIITSQSQPQSAQADDVVQGKDDGEKKSLVAQTTDTKAQNTLQTTTPLTTQVTGQSSTEPVEDDIDEDDQIQMAVPSEMLNNPGDTCAICIDTLEDDDDVRGLTCGHAFHASCLDPWLTSRRACCPLCKADYYVPKPRPEGEAAPETERSDRGRRQAGPRMDAPRPPQYAFQRPGGGRMLFPGRFRPTVADQDQRPRYAFPTRLSRPPRARANRAPPPTTPTATTSAPEIVTEQPETWRSRMRNFMNTAPHVNLPGRTRRNNADGDTQQSEPNTTEPTPAQLEAGR